MLTRREFARSVSAAGMVAATPLGLTGAMGASASGREIRKAVKFGMVRIEGSIADKFRLLKELGYDGVELDSPNTLDNNEVIDASKEVGLPIHGVVDSVHWGKPFSHPDAAVRAEGVKALETALEDSKAYGGSSVLVVPAVVNKSVAYADAYERSFAEISKVIPLAEELEIDIAFENVWNNFLLSPLEAARYVDAFESERVGWYFDVGNIVRFAWPEHWVRALGHRVFKLDIKEYSRKKQNDEGLWKGFNVEIGDGDCDWPAVMAALDEVGFDGWATAEVGGGGEERLKDIAQRMDRVLSA